MMGTHAKKYIFRRFRHGVHQECAYTNLDGTAYHTPRPYGTNLMGTPSYMWSIVERTPLCRYVFKQNLIDWCPSDGQIGGSSS